MPIPPVNLDLVSLILVGVLALMVGGNNLSAVSGTIIGTGIVRTRTGITLAAIGYVLGLLVEGPKLFRLPQVFLPHETGLEVVSTVAGTLVVFLMGEAVKVPISLSKALTGAVVGTSVAIGTFTWKPYLGLIIGFWILTPIIATTLGVILIRLDYKYSIKNTWKKLSILRVGLLIVAFLTAYALGSNTLGLIAGLPNSQSTISIGIVGVASVAGAYLLGRGTLRRLMEGLFTLRYPNAFFSQLVGSSAVELASQFGVPLAVTETVSSGIIGSGLGTRMRMMNVRNVALIIMSWFLSPVVGLTAGFLLRRLLS